MEEKKNVLSTGPAPENSEATATNAPTPLTGPGTYMGRAMTFGEKAVGLTFNPSGDSTVQHIKELSAQIIDALCLIEKVGALEAPNDSIRPILFEKSVLDAIAACMSAGKAITYQF